MSAHRRRIILALSLCVSWMPLTGQGQAPFSQGSAGALPVFIVTDIHYLAPSLHDSGPAFRDMVISGDGKDTSHCEAILDALAYELPKPSILLVTGDLTLNGEEASHRALARRFEALEKAGIKVYVLPGNHDLDNPWATKFFGPSRGRVASVSAGQFREIYEACGYSAATSSDEASLSYYAELDSGRAALMLDSTEHDRNIAQGYPSSGGRLSESTLAWVDRTLDLAERRGRKVIVAMHHNLLDHNSMLSENYTLDNAEELVRLLQRHEQQFILDGHIHIQSIAERSDEAGDIFDIATGSLAVYPHNYGRLDFDLAGKRIVYGSKRLDVAAWASATHCKDPYLEDFAKSSAEYFGGFARRLVDKLGLTDGLTQGEIEHLLDFMAELNRQFFAGTIDASERKELQASSGYAAIAKLRGSFLADYVASILDPGGADSNSLSLPIGTE
jgi:3',5'-cyclic AMP phosphodiesterase CpdA